MKKVSIADSDLQVVRTALEEGKISMEDILDLINKEDNQAENNSEEIITLTVDYSRNIEQMIADGKYNWKNDNVTENNFPIPAEMKGKKVEISTKLFYFNHVISGEDVKEEMDKEDFRPANAFELLVLGAIYPELQRQFIIIALGSVWQDARDNRLVPYLHVVDDKRRLLLHRLVYNWHANCHFLAVRK